MVDNDLVPKRLWSNLVPMLCKIFYNHFVGIFKEELIEVLKSNSTRIVIQRTVTDHSKHNSTTSRSTEIGGHYSSILLNFIRRTVMLSSQRPLI